MIISELGTYFLHLGHLYLPESVGDGCLMTVIVSSVIDATSRGAKSWNKQRPIVPMASTDVEVTSCGSVKTEAAEDLGVSSIGEKKSSGEETAVKNERM